ncbi:UxaA family hydrolase [Desulfocurvus sp. DL9XJH121]
MEFQGYVRPDGKVGIRNYTLILPNGRGIGVLADQVAKLVRNSKIFIPPNENGRDSEDRATIARTIVGLAKNPNVGAVLIMGIKSNGGYPEFTREAMVDEIYATGKPVDSVFLEDCPGGAYEALGKALLKARHLARKASECRRETVDLGRLCMGVKCGYSDATSGMAGNPTVGYLFDRLVEAGGTAMFAETTEVIGADHIVARRFNDDKQRETFLAAVKRVEDEAKATGEDIRTINPIPANIQAGLTTLEEKSLGAIAKSGHMPLSSSLRYGEIPAGPGLHFMDSWMSSATLFLGFAAAGSALSIFQVGGGWFPDRMMMPTASAGLVTPTLYMTGNPRTYAKTNMDMDFSASEIISQREPIEQAGERLVQRVCELASGHLTMGETLNVDDNVEIYLRGPGL